MTHPNSGRNKNMAGVILFNVFHPAMIPETQ
jgi:hypothetical protein